MLPTVLFDARRLTHAAPQLFVVQGAAGNSTYQRQFSEWVDGWRALGETMDAEVRLIGDSQPQTSQSDREQLRQHLVTASQEQTERLWIVLIGHGTYYNETAKFNLRGPDFSAQQLADWLQPVRRPIAIINCSSSSGVFINRLSASNRIIVTATRSGSEYNFSRFGKFMVQAAASPTSDLDHDGSVSILEAFLTASRNTQTFYRDEGRLATEHALVDDNGDGMGTSEDFFHGIRATGNARDADQQVDGRLAHQWKLYRYSDEPPLSEAAIEQRNGLERQIAELRQRKSELGEEEYYRLLEPLMVKVARLYE